MTLSWPNKFGLPNNSVYQTLLQESTGAKDSEEHFLNID